MKRRNFIVFCIAVLLSLSMFFAVACLDKDDEDGIVDYSQYITYRLKGDSYIVTGLEEEASENLYSKYDDYDTLQPPAAYCKITIPDQHLGIPVTGIISNAFVNCAGIKKVYLPDCIESVGEGAFSGCSGLICIEVDENNEFYHSSGNCLIETSSNTLIAGCTSSIIPSDGSVTSIGNSAFFGCSNLTEIIIPDSVVSIGDYSFYECTGLTGLIIPDSVINIGISAFLDCTSLASVTMPDSIINIGNSAFYNCAGLTQVHIADISKWCASTFDSFTANPLTYAHNLYLNGELVNDLVIPDSVTSICAGAFSGCSSLSSITIPHGVTSIGMHAFNNCTALTVINFSGTKDEWNAISKDSFWNIDTGDYIISCTDGEISS